MTKRAINSRIAYLKRRFKREDVDLMKLTYLEEIDELYQTLEQRGLNKTEKVQRSAWSRMALAYWSGEA